VKGARTRCGDVNTLPRPAFFYFRVDSIHVCEHFSDDGVELARDMIADLQTRKRFDERGFFVQRNAVLFCNPDDLGCSDARPTARSCGGSGLSGS
jgi:hypothetical protein